MRRPRLSSDEYEFVSRVRALEQQLFKNELHLDDSSRMKNDQYSWLYRPSHHVATKLITESDIKMLSLPDKHLLSVGAHPAYLERLLLELGVPTEHILIADSDPALKAAKKSLRSLQFDMLEPWPEIGMFDLIIFPESLCIAMADRIAKEGSDQNGEEFPTDAREAELLSAVLSQALKRLEPHGEIRANGPQSHPNVVNAAKDMLSEQGIQHELEYQRYFLSVTKS